MVDSQSNKPGILYSCYFTRSREGEQFIPEHVFSFQIAGTLKINDGKKTYLFEQGDCRLSRRNHLAKFEKQPPEDGEFKSLSVYLDQETLREFSREFNVKAQKKAAADDAVIILNNHPVYQSFKESLFVYLQLPGEEKMKLMRLKIKEAIQLMLMINPEVQDILFDFNEPGKINLEAFMNRNFHFNVDLNKFAYLTGRSLSTFKRDFEKLYNITPSRWLLQRRLQEAYFLIKEKGQSPSAVYMDLGFEDLSHFSYAFKKQYGAPPTLI